MSGPQTQGSPASSSSPSLQEGFTQFLKAKSKGNKSVNYRRNAKRVIIRWIDWLDQRDVDTFEQLDETVLAHYAEYLRRRVAAKEAETTDGGIARSTAWTYYNMISAFLGWASKWDYIQENYARQGLHRSRCPSGLHHSKPNSSSGHQTNGLRSSTTSISALTTPLTRRDSTLGRSTRPSPRRSAGVYGRSWLRDLPFRAR